MADSPASNRKIIVGLGNPGRQYEKTRHNVGFDAIANLHRKYGEGLLKAKFEGQFAITSMRNTSVVLLWPLTYMNGSGRCVSQVASFYQVSPENVLVICDDMSLPLGKIRMRSRGSSGGQKGLADILRALGSENIPRLRIGVGSPPSGWNVADFVLGRFRSDEVEAVGYAVDKAAAASEDWVEHGIDFCMNQYNRGD